MGAYSFGTIRGGRYNITITNLQIALADAFMRSPLAP